jgi:hypothetical protein
MPSHEQHCKLSLERYGKDFSGLHGWMDEPAVVIVGMTHRKFRHDIYTTPQEALKIFGEFADQACIDHIKQDANEDRKREKKPKRSKYEEILVRLERLEKNNPTAITEISFIPSSSVSKADGDGLTMWGFLVKQGKNPEEYLKSYNGSQSTFSLPEDLFLSFLSEKCKSENNEKLLVDELKIKTGLSESECWAMLAQSHYRNIIKSFPRAFK